MKVRMHINGKTMCVCVVALSCGTESLAQFFSITYVKMTQNYKEDIAVGYLDFLQMHLTKIVTLFLYKSHLHFGIIVKVTI